MRLEPRQAGAVWQRFAPMAWALAAALGFASLLVAWAGAPIGPTWGLVFTGAFGSVFAWSETLTRATPLIFTGLAACVAFKARLFNIGAEGQLYAGALAAVAVGSSLPDSMWQDMPFALRFVALWACAALAGGLLLLGPALLKARMQVDEVVTTLLLNFVVLLAVGAALDGPMKDPSAMGWPQSVALDADFELDKLIAQTRLHSGLLFGLAAALACAVLFRYTVLGFEIRAVGASASAAAFAHVRVTRTVVVTALLSGALAGLGGAVEVAGRTGYVTLDMSPGYGMAGVVVAMLAGLNPLGVVAASVFVAGMLVGADSMSRAMVVPTYLADVVVAVSLLAVLVGVMLTRWRIRWR